MAVGVPPADDPSNQTREREFWAGQPFPQQEVLLVWRCLESFSNHTSDAGGCNATWDQVSCWPPTAGGATAVLPCVASIRGVLYDTSQNVTRLCQVGGTWAPKSDYTHCNPLVKEDEDLQVLWELREASTVYHIGYGMSLVALILALWIFLYFKDLHCVRNTIHVNLLVTFALIDLTWIVTATLQSNPFGESYKASCVLVIFLTFLMGTNFFWMFVEGLYLYVMVVRTFSMERLKLCSYALLGWGAPGVFVVAWATVKAIYGNNSDDPLAKQGCPWQNRDNYDYIFICPIIAVLLINIYFLCEIMWVLITKLRAANTLESKQYWKAAKALLVLIPLLGVTYVLVLVSPSHRTARVVFAYLQAALLSTQGFYVAVLYCFLNAEVRQSLRQHLERWKMRRNLCRGGQQAGQRGSVSQRYSLAGEAQDRRRASQQSRGDVTSCLLLSISGAQTPTSDRRRAASGGPLSASCDSLVTSGRQPVISGDQRSTSGFLCSGDKRNNFRSQPFTSGGLPSVPGAPPFACQRSTSGALSPSSGQHSPVSKQRNGQSNGGTRYQPLTSPLTTSSSLV